MTRVLITGGGGFIGHHVVEHIIETTDWDIAVLDSFRHKGTYSRLDEVMSSFKRDALARLQVFHHDLNAPIDYALERKMGNFDYAINLASNSAVERSVSDARECWENNCAIAINMLEWVHTQAWSPLRAFLHISTDEVHGPCRASRSHEEWDIIAPTNPYAASKAAQEALFIAAKFTYNLPVIIANTMNNYGERQDPEKFIPRIIGQIYREEQVQIYTNSAGEIGSRHYLHCKDHADAMLNILMQCDYKSCDPLDLPIRYNVAGSEEFSNLEVANLVAGMMGKNLQYKLINPQEKRPTYDLRYSLNPYLLSVNTGWEAPKGFEIGLQETVEFTLENQQWMGRD